MPTTHTVGSRILSILALRHTLGAGIALCQQDVGQRVNGGYVTCHQRTAHRTAGPNRLRWRARVTADLNEYWRQVVRIFE